MPSQPISERKFLAIDGREARCWTSEAFRLPSDKGNNGDVLQLRLRGASVAVSRDTDMPRTLHSFVNGRGTTTALAAGPTWQGSLTTAKGYETVTWEGPRS